MNKKNMMNESKYFFRLEPPPGLLDKQWNETACLQAEYDKLYGFIRVEYPEYHWFWYLSEKDKDFCHYLGEASFIHHKNIIAKALRAYSCEHVNPINTNHLD